MIFNCQSKNNNNSPPMKRREWLPHKSGAGKDHSRYGRYLEIAWSTTMLWGRRTPPLPDSIQAGYLIYSFRLYIGMGEPSLAHLVINCFPRVFYFILFLVTSLGKKNCAGAWIGAQTAREPSLFYPWKLEELVAGEPNWWHHITVS